MEDTKFKLVEVRRVQQKFSLSEHVIEWKIWGCYATFVVRTAVILETRIFCDIRPCGVVNWYLRFQGSLPVRYVFLDFLTPNMKALDLSKRPFTIYQSTHGVTFHKT